jgi:hypothetical protein
MVEANIGLGQAQVLPLLIINIPLLVATIIALLPLQPVVKKIAHSLLNMMPVPV